LDGLRLNQFGMHEVVDEVAVFVLRPPCRTTYRFIIYALDSDLEVPPDLKLSRLDSWRRDIAGVNYTAILDTYYGQLYFCTVA